MSDNRRAAAAVAGALAVLGACVFQARGQSAATAPATGAGAAVSVTVDSLAPGVVIPADFLGVSLELQILLPDKEGQYYFRAENKPLIAMFRTLGIHILRVGGNTADTPSVKIPGRKDIDSLFAFARAAGVKVIYTLRLRNATDPEGDAAIAKYIMDQYGSDVLCFEVGNEPDLYAKPYAHYKKMFDSFAAVIKSPTWAPESAFCGPNGTQGATTWARQLANDNGATGPVRLITQHAYFGGSARKVTDPAAGRQQMLSPKWLGQYQKMADAFVPACVENKLPWRIEETNSFYNGGAKDVSNTHAAALWALDYLYWWASHGAAGLNFHTGDHVAAGDEQTPCWYAAYWSSPTGYEAHPVGYAMKAFDVGAHGAIVPAKIAVGEGGELNMTAYAVVGADRKLYVTLINKESGEKPRDAAVTIAAEGYGNAEALPLVAKGNDLAATDTEMLGGARIGEDGTWAGTWTAVGGAVVDVPAGSAVVVRLTGG